MPNHSAIWPSDVISAQNLEESENHNLNSQIRLRIIEEVENIGGQVVFQPLALFLGLAIGSHNGSIWIIPVDRCPFSKN